MKSRMIKFIASENQIVRTSLNRVTEPEKEVLSLLLENPAYTYAVLADKLGISRKNVSLRIKQLNEKGILQRIGSDTKGHWHINKNQ